MTSQLFTRLAFLAMVVSWPLSFAVGNIAFGVLAALVLGFSFFAPRVAKERLLTNSRALTPVGIWLLLIAAELLYSEGSAKWAQHFGFRFAAVVYLLALAYFRPPEEFFRALIYRILPFVLMLMVLHNFIHYYSHEDYFLYELTWSHSIPIIFPWRNPLILNIKSDISHIYFGILNAFSALLLVNRLLSRSSTLHRRTCDGLLAAVLLFYLHLFSERTGLLILYGTLPMLIVYTTLIQKRRYGLLFASVLLCSGIAFVSYSYLPTVQERVKKTKEDFESFKRGDVHHHSIGKRLLAWQVGTEIFLDHPIVGVGHTRIDAQMQRVYAEKGYHDPRAEQITYPHNQFIHTAAEGGILQLAVLLAVLIAPLFWRPGYLSRLEILILIVGTCLTFISVSFLQRQVGAYFFWMLWALAVVRRP